MKIVSRFCVRFFLIIYFGVFLTNPLGYSEDGPFIELANYRFDPLSVIERLIRLYTNPGEIVFSPFTGIGSEGYEAIKLGRRFYGCELKDEYIEAARKNLGRAEIIRADETRSLFDMVGQ